MWHVKLIETWPCTVGLSDSFYRSGAGGGESIGEVEFVGDPCNRKFPERMIYFIDSDGCKADGGGD